MILSDKDIKDAIDSGLISVGGMLDPNVQIQPASLDVRLSKDLLCFTQDLFAGYREIDVGADIPASSHYRDVIPDEGFVLEPKGFVLGRTIENIRLGPSIAAQVSGRSSLGRLGIAVHVTAGFIDPGFEGHITLELANLGVVPVRLRPGMRIAQIVFSRLLNQCERPYGAERGSKYVGEYAYGVVASRISKGK